MKLLAVLTILTTSVAAQTFEVASVKPGSDAGSAQIKAEAAGVTITHAALSYVIRWAYRLQTSQLEGGADWVRAVPYDIFAKAAKPTTESELRIMMQNLLSDRFQLQVQWKETPTKIDMMRVPPDARRNFVPSSVAIPHVPRSGDLPRWEGIEFSYLAEQCSLGQSYGTPVIDDTGILGRWDFTLTVTPPPRPQTMEGPDSYFVWAADVASATRKALTQQLGVTFTREFYPIKKLVIDHINRPTPN